MVALAVLHVRDGRGRKRRAGFAGIDFLGCCLTMLRDHPKWELSLLAVPDDSDPRAQMILALAERLHLPLLAGKPTTKWSDSIESAGLDLLVVAGYRWRVPVEQLTVPYMLNVHPSLLPKGKGPNPLPQFFRGHPDAAGVSIHVLARDFDAGDIICQAAIDVGDRDVTDVYLESVAQARLLLGKVLDDIDSAYGKRRSQTGFGQYLPEISWTARTFDAAMTTVAELETLAAAFGPFGMSARFPDGSRQEVVVRRTLRFDHGESGGRFVQWSSTRGVLQVADGYALVSMSALV